MRMAKFSSDYPSEITAPLKEVLSLMLWSTGPIAHALRADGVDIPRKSEDEQAHVMHWMIGLALQYGDHWQEKVCERLSKIAAKAPE